MYRILIADDERKIRETIRDYLEAKGFSIIMAKDGAEALEKAADEILDLIILDVLMPELNGIETCKEIRVFSDVPVLFLSALGEEADLLKGFGAGADDYVVKPFPLSVLEQKCRQIIRRSKGAEHGETLRVSGITVDYAAHKVYIDSIEAPHKEGNEPHKDGNEPHKDGNEPHKDGEAPCEVSLTGKDFALLTYLMENKNIVLDRERILAKVWGYGFDGDSRVVDTHVKNIRKALGSKGDLIETVVGTGYIFRGE